MELSYCINRNQDGLVVVCCQNAEENCVIPSETVFEGKTYPVTEIGVSAFRGCTSLKSITIPDTVTNIDVWAFVGCSSLESITIPESFTSIGYCAFLVAVVLKPSPYLGTVVNYLNKHSELIPSVL